MDQGGFAGSSGCKPSPLRASVTPDTRSRAAEIDLGRLGQFNVFGRAGPDEEHLRAALARPSQVRGAKLRPGTGGVQRELLGFCLATDRDVEIPVERFSPALNLPDFVAVISG